MGIVITSTGRPGANWRRARWSELDDCDLGSVDLYAVFIGERVAKPSVWALVGYL
jgi:hypothetical protein